MKSYTDESLLTMNKPNNRLSAFLEIENGCLSSKYTFFWKYIFMPGWILSYWPVVLTCAWNRLQWVWVSAMFIPWLLGAIYFYFTYGKIKKVVLAGSQFAISNYREEMTINISDVDSVGGSIFLNPELVWLNLKTDSKFGKRIIFAPEQRSTFSFSSAFTKHPLVAQLNTLCSIAEEL